MVSHGEQAMPLNLHAAIRCQASTGECVKTWCGVVRSLGHRTSTAYESRIRGGVGNEVG